MAQLRVQKKNLSLGEGSVIIKTKNNRGSLYERNSAI